MESNLFVIIGLLEVVWSRQSAWGYVLKAAKNMSSATAMRRRLFTAGCLLEAVSNKISARGSKLNSV
jgi:hypothetical protein